MYKLVISDDEGHTTVVPLLRTEITIGRHEGNTIRLTERNVSRNHARLLKRNGSYIVEDLGSYNGVTVNGERIDVRSELAAGDQLGIGDYDLAFQSDTSAAAQTLPSPKPKSLPPPKLVMLSDLAAGAEFTLSKPAVRIGRDERLDIWINHKSISHEHAEVQVEDGKATIYDLDSANGIRVNGIKTSRAVLESGDVLVLGDVRFRFLPPQGSHSLEPGHEEPSVLQAPAPRRKLIFMLSLISLLLVAAAGAVLVTMRGGGEANPTRASAARRAKVASAPSARPETGKAAGGDSDAPSIDEPHEWEGQLSRARRAMARGRADRAYAIADELPADSVLRGTPEFGEIRYRYAESHIEQAERALEDGDLEKARTEAQLVLDLRGITAKQRRVAKRLMRSATESRPENHGGAQNR